MKTQRLILADVNGGFQSRNLAMHNRDLNTSGINLPNTSVSADKDLFADGLIDGEKAMDKREAARIALLHLHSDGMTFDQIIDHGVNAEVLHSLCVEAGISPGRSADPRQEQLKPLSHNTFLNQKNSKSPNHMNSPVNDISSAPVNSVISITSSTITPVTNDQTPKDEAIGKVSTTKATGAKIMDRKDYIARMLAAKAGKPDNSPAMPVLLKTSSASAPVAKIQASTKAEALNSKPTIFEKQSDPEASDRSMQPKDIQDVEAKRKAITDLARQKMEALKLQQETRHAMNDEPLQQAPSKPATGAGQTHTVEDTIDRRPSTSNRPTSYFSPISQNSAFVLPGLFMTTTGPGAAAAASSPSNSKIPQDVDHHDQETASRPAIPASHNTPATLVKPAGEEAASVQGDGQPVTVVQSNTTLHRKRQKAADFLDPPATRVKRPLKQQDNSDIIIDISEEEALDYSDDDEGLESGNVTKRNIALRHPPMMDLTDVGIDSVNKTPPLGSSPNRRNGSVIATPSALPDSSRAQRPEGLKTKEMEIELMQRKIAELEQRRRAKKTTSRAETPSAAAVTKSLSHSGTVSDLQEHREGSRAATEKVSDEPEGAKSSNDAEVANQIGVEATEQKLHEVEQAKAEIERSLAADIASVSKEKQRSASRSVSRDPDAPENVKALNVPSSPPELKPSQIPIFAHETDMLEETHPSETRTPDRLENGGLSSQQEQAATSEVVGNVIIQNQDQNEALNEQQRQRRDAIESGIPILDAIIDRTQKKAEDLRKQLASLEAEVQRGVDGRKALMEELSSLSNRAETQNGPEQPYVVDRSTAKSPVTKGKQGQ